MNAASEIEPLPSCKYSSVSRWEATNDRRLIDTAVLLSFDFVVMHNIDKPKSSPSTLTHDQPADERNSHTRSGQ